MSTPNLSDEIRAMCTNMHCTCADAIDARMEEYRGLTVEHQTKFRFFSVDTNGNVAITTITTSVEVPVPQEIIEMLVIAEILDEIGDEDEDSVSPVDMFFDPSGRARAYDGHPAFA